MYNLFAIIYYSYSKGWRKSKKPQQHGQSCAVYEKISITSQEKSFFWVSANNCPDRWFGPRVVSPGSEAEKYHQLKE